MVAAGEVWIWKRGGELMATDFRGGDPRGQLRSSSGRPTRSVQVIGFVFGYHSWPATTLSVFGIHFFE